MGIIGMKIFLAQIYCLFLLFIMKYRYHRNENISGANLLLVPFVYDSKKLGKKMFDVVYKHHAAVCV